MRVVCGSVMAAVGMLLASALANAADIARLEWGGFVVADDSSNGWSDTKSVSSDDGRSVTLTFSSLEAKADGDIMQNEAHIAGRYDVIQPTYERVASYRVEVTGLVAKGQNTVATLTIRLGDAEQIIAWPKEQMVSEKFQRTLAFAVAEDGRLPSPLTVSVQADVGKDGKEGAAFLSVSSVTLTAEYTKVAAQ